MASDPTFVAHVLDLVGLVAPVEARRMFGGHGLYAHGVMFGLLDDGELFLKTDEESRPRFALAGCRRWTYVTKKVRMEETSYFRPPDEAHEGAEAMLPWARLALDAALRLRTARLAEAARRAAAKAARDAAAKARAPAPARPRKPAGAPRAAKPGRPPRKAVGADRPAKPARTARKARTATSAKAPTRRPARRRKR